jgi:hypothetical protein
MYLLDKQEIEQHENDKEYITTKIMKEKYFHSRDRYIFCF